jgi:hypothetical protein
MWQIPVMLGAAALQGVLGNRQQKQQQTSRQNSQSNSNFANYSNNFSNQSSRTEYDPALLGLRGNLISQANEYMKPASGVSPNSWAQSVVQQGVSGINSQAALRQRVLQNALRQRGLGSSVAGAYGAAQGEGDRVSNLINNSNQLPILQRQAELEDSQRQNQRQQLANQIFSMIPKDTYQEGWQGGSQWGGSETKGTQEGMSESTIPGNPTAGGFSSLASMLASMFGSGIFGDPKSWMGGGGGSTTNGSVNPYYRLPSLTGGK